MSEYLFLLWLDFYNKALFNTLPKITPNLIEARCFNCNNPCYVNYMYGNSYPLCRQCANDILN